MPLDAICLAAVREELAGRITGMKIEKVQQPERDIVLLSLRGAAQPCRLLISAGSGDMRVHLTEHRFDNPASPPMLCMLLRKHLTSARIAGVGQPPSERVLELVLEAPDAMGVISEKRLIIELIGRLGNIILTDSSGLIIDCLRRIGGELSDKRTVLPGLIYRAPSKQEGKLDPRGVTSGQWREALAAASASMSADKWLLSTFTALSPLICRELSWRAYGESDYRLDMAGDGGAALEREFFTLMDTAARGFEPWILISDDNIPKDFSYTRIMQYEGALTAEREESFSSMLDDFYTRTALIARVRQRASVTAKAINTARDRLARKLAAQRTELDNTANRERSRECGDLIIANLHRMVKGQRVLLAEDYYSRDGGTREIALDTKMTPQQNAARYYKDYTKAKNAEKVLTEQLRIGESELTYLDSVLEEISLAEGERDLIEIRRELVQTGYIKDPRHVKEKPAESAPMRFESSSGFTILAGRNNMQNDKLTLKTALRSDVWLHAQKTHGAHVIICCGGAEADEASVFEAAAIAAYYSSSRASGKVAVDYSSVSRVKKLPGGRPGMVVYTDYKTIITSPDEALVNRLRRV